MAKARGIATFAARVLRSPKFFIFTLLFFVAQSSLFAVIVDPSLQNGETYMERSAGLVPDGNRHMSAIYYYADRPIADGPFVQEMEPSDLSMGDLVRFPSYMYYYLMSFPVKAALALSWSDWAIILLVRFIGIGFGVLALVVFRKILRELKIETLVTNLSVLALATMGAFAYFAPAENYDMLALLLWFCFFLPSVRLFTRRDTTQLYWMLLSFCIISVTKYTYAPFAGLIGLAAVSTYIYRVGGFAVAYQRLKKDWAQLWRKTRKWVIALATVVLVISVGLFVERIGINLVKYQSLSPNCAKVHSDEACRNFGVYNRNVTRLEQVKKGEAYTQDYDPIVYTKDWIWRYYTSMYYYMGHIWVNVPPFMVLANAILFLSILIISIVVLIRRKVRIIQGFNEWFLLGVATLFVVAQYVFNVDTFIHYSGNMYGHQGRYLLPMIGIAYVLYAIIVLRAYRAAKTKHTRAVGSVLVAACLCILIGNSAIVNFYVAMDSSAWLSEPGKAITPESWQSRDNAYYRYMRDY